jgi:hypothetical protein
MVFIVKFLSYEDQVLLMIDEHKKKKFMNYLKHIPEEESKRIFLIKLLKMPHGECIKYLQDFLNESLEDLGEKIYKEKINYNVHERRHNEDLYDMEYDPEKIMLVYKGLTRKITKIEDTLRVKIYKKYFNFDILKQRKANKSKQEIYDLFLEKYKRYAMNLSQDQLEKFIDDIFDESVSGEMMFPL